jgi:hypothetical protein
MIQNLKNKGTVYTGFMIVTAIDSVGVGKVEVAFDSGAYTSAQGTTSWKMKLPSGSSTWKDGSKHIINVRAVNITGGISPVTSITVYKDKNHDINGDGYSDMVATTVAAGPGVVFIFHSSGSSGIVAVNTTSAVASIAGSTNQDQFGYSINSGDINGDGYADLIVGADQQGAGSPIGKVLVYLSSGSSGINVTPHATYVGENSGSRLGSFVWIMDINGDGFKDVIMGSAYINTGDGKMYIFHSSSAGVPTLPVTSANRVIIGEVGGGGRFAAGISGSDINGDGYGDIITTANVLTNTQDGRVYIMYSNGTTGISNTTAASITTKINPVFNSNKRFGYQVY